MSETYSPDEELADSLREIREQVRQEEGLPWNKPDPTQEERYLYGDHDLELFPQFRRRLGELHTRHLIREQPFSSGLPLVGRLIAWFRERWNRVSTKWYVQPMLAQQNQFNALVAQLFQDAYQLQRDSSLDLARRMDALFTILTRGQAGVNARLQDQHAQIRDLNTRNEGLTGHVLELQKGVDFITERLQEVYQGSDFMQERLREVQQKTGTLYDQVQLMQEASQRELEKVSREQQELAQQQVLDRRATSFVRSEASRLMELLSSARDLSPQELEQVASRQETLQDLDYYRFEERYRPESDVKAYQQRYVPFFEGRRNVLDLGCGKGEFLEVLRSAGIEAYGVDLNESMVHMCQEKGLLAFQGDALEHLAGLPDDSLGGLLAAHLIEHLPPSTLREMTQLALAKIEPGAYIILETPNPLSVWALTNYFYMDMSHVKPVHPKAISFILEMQGYRDIEVQYLSPIPHHVQMELLPENTRTSWREIVGLLNQNLERLNDFLYGFADYAIIARK
ncbi:MAG: methyltransferase domain-containing protein [Chloroflexia bacterium]|nr:methyltransferase domain-containing protein [Chloroflexia bacterium]